MSSANPAVLTATTPATTVTAANPLKILFVITGLGAGGAEKMLLRLATRLSERIQLTVVSLTGRGPLAEDFERAGIPLRALGMRGFASLPLAVTELFRLMRSIRPDVVSTWMYHADLVGGIAAKLAGIGAIAWNIRNGHVSAEPSAWATRAVVRLNAALSRVIPTVILCCSGTAQQIHTDLGYDASRFLLVPNGFDLKQFSPDPQAAALVRAELAIAQGAPLVGFFARWDSQKNHRGFVDAAILLRQLVPDAHFLLAGDGCSGSNPTLVRWIGEAGLTGAFRLLGRRADMPRLTAALDLAASSSLSEAFPNVLGEAMACGVPCVFTDVGDSAAILGDAGRIVAPGDAPALASACAGILRMDPAERKALGAAARTRVSTLFELGEITRRYEELFRGLAALRQVKPCAA